MPPTDHLLQLIDTSLSFDTHSFLRDIAFIALLSSEPEKLLSRFEVKSLTHCKEPRSEGSTAPQHEFIVVELIDTHDQLAEATPPFLMFLERAASADRSPISQFTAHPDSASVLKSIVQTLKELPLATVQALGAQVSSPLPHSSDSHYEAIDPQLEPEFSASSSNLPLPFLDGAALATGRLLQVSSKSASSKGPRPAEDRFTGGKNLETYYRSAHNIRQLQPEDLTLFDLAVLAHTVHDHDPLYSLLQHQCYWFASIVCDVVEMEYVCRRVGGRKQRSNICIPPNDYLPNLAGRWAGILVNRVEEAVATVVALGFRKGLQEKREEVSFPIFLILNAPC